jgi:integrase/recombinase XerD
MPEDRGRSLLTDSAVDGPDGVDQRSNHPDESLISVVGAYLDHLAVERGLAVNTVRAYRRDLDRYADALIAAGHVGLGTVGVRDIGTYLRTLREGDGEHSPLAPASAARAVSAVRGLHRFAAREGVVADDATRDVRPPVPPRRLPKALDVDQVARLLDAARGEEPLALRDVALLEFLYSTGARISEAVGCAVDDLDLADCSVLLRGKGGKTRVVPVGAYARSALEAYLARGRPALLAHHRRAGRRGRDGHEVFRNARGGPLSRQGAWGILRLAARRAGLSVEVSPHALRHSFATHLLDGGADVRVVQELLGHASVTTTQIYTLVTVEKLREVYVTSHPRARG